MKIEKQSRNLTMLMDFYELTMANGYFVNGKKDTIVVFDLFYRHNPDDGGFVICAGLEQMIAYIQALHFTEEDIAYLRKRNIFNETFLAYLRKFRFTGTIEAIPEGTIVYPNTPLITVTAPVIEAQLIETMLLLTINHQSLIATKANRIVRAAKGRAVLEFGARRAQGYDGAVYGARAAYIGGVSGTATTIADQWFGVPAVGTMAHSWIQLFSTEYEAFQAYAEAYMDHCTLLVDTYDVLHSGVKNAIRIAREILEPNGKRLKGIRIDSGDLAYLSREARKMLDEAQLQDCQIIVSNSVDEYLMQSLMNQQACIDVFAVGERLITSRSEPVFGGVYKLVAVQEKEVFVPRIKRSETIEKITTPGKKTLYRIYQQDGKAIADYLALEEEIINPDQPLLLFDPNAPWKKRWITNFTVKKLQQPIFQNGELVYQAPALAEIREFVQKQLKNEVFEEEQRFENPHQHYVDLSTQLHRLKLDMIEASEKEIKD